MHVQYNQPYCTKILVRCGLLLSFITETKIDVYNKNKARTNVAECWRILLYQVISDVSFISV